MDIGKVIRALRIERGLTQEQLALEAETATSNISRVENGLRTPSMGLLHRVADALGTTVSALHRAAEGHPPSVQHDRMLAREPEPLQVHAIEQIYVEEAAPNSGLSIKPSANRQPGPSEPDDQWLSPSSLSLLKLYNELSAERQHLALEYLRMLRRIQSEQDS